MLPGSLITGARGFGPGNFEWAVTTLSFLLRDNGTVLCDMDFAAGPRPEKVFDFGDVPDPIYGPADELEKLTPGVFPVGKVPDFRDEKMAAQHCGVHQASMEGTSRIFGAMVADGALKPPEY